MNAGSKETKTDATRFAVRTDANSDVAAGVRRWAIKGVVGVLTVALFLFIPAWRWNWGMGWALVGIWAAWQGVLAVLLIPRNPELLAERATGPRKDNKTWDTVLMSIAGLVTIGQYVVAGLDDRYGWTPQVWAPIAPTLQIVALVVTALGYALVPWAMVANAFFSKVVRIQEDRGHTVATRGPYRYVRHPGYVGQIVVAFAVPIMLGSLWALIPGLVLALLFVVRTALEDRTLQQELDGYAEYAQRVRYRLLPGVW